MSRENTTIRDKIKYVQSDFINGLSYLRIAVYTTIDALINKEIKEIEIDSIEINGFFLSELIEYCYPDVKFEICDKSYIVFKINNNMINVIINDKLRWELISI